MFVGRSSVISVRETHACSSGLAAVVVGMRLWLHEHMSGMSKQLPAVCGATHSADFPANATVLTGCLPAALSPFTLCYAVCREGAPPAAIQTSVYQYNHQDGTLHLPFSNPGSSPVSLAEISAHNRRFPQLTQVCGAGWRGR